MKSEFQDLSVVVSEEMVQLCRIFFYQYTFFFFLFFFFFFFLTISLIQISVYSLFTRFFVFQLYNFGETVSIVFWTDTWKPDSFYDKICTNLERGMHTLCLLGMVGKF